MTLLIKGWESIKALLKNPTLYVPDLFLYVVTYFLTIFLYRSSGIDAVLQNIIMDGAAQVDIFTAFIATNWFHLLVSGAVFVIVTFFIGVGVEIIKFRMMLEIVNGKKPSLIKTIFSKHGFLMRVVFMKVYIYFLSATLVLVSTAVIAISRQMENDLLSSFVKLSALLLGITIILLIKMGTLYRNALMFMSNENSAIRALKRSFKLLFKKPKDVISIWIVLVMVSMVAWILMSGFGLLANLLQGVFGTIGIYLVSIVLMLFLYLIKLTTTLWENLFVFFTYKTIKKSS